MSGNYWDNRQFSEFKKKATLDRTSDFIVSLMRKFSTATSNRYCVEFVLPPMLTTYISKRDPSFKNMEQYERIKINCSSINTPAITYNNTETTNCPHEETIPNNYSNGMFNLSFTCFADMKEKILLDYWMNFIYNVKTRTYMFLNEYATDFHIFQLDAKNKATYGLIAGRAFPTYVSEIRYNSSSDNSPITVDAYFHHQYLDTFNYTEDNSFTSTSNKSSNLQPGLGQTNPKSSKVKTLDYDLHKPWPIA